MIGSGSLRRHAASGSAPPRSSRCGEQTRPERSTLSRASRTAAFESIGGRDDDDEPDDDSDGPPRPTAAAAPARADGAKGFCAASPFDDEAAEKVRQHVRP